MASYVTLCASRERSDRPRFIWRAVPIQLRAGCSVIFFAARLASPVLGTSSVRVRHWHDFPTLPLHASPTTCQRDGFSPLNMVILTVMAVSVEVAAGCGFHVAGDLPFHLLAAVAGVMRLHRLSLATARASMRRRSNWPLRSKHSAGIEAIRQRITWLCTFLPSGSILNPMNKIAELQTRHRRFPTGSC